MLPAVGDPGRVAVVVFKYGAGFGGGKMAEGTCRASPGFRDDELSPGKCYRTFRRKWALADPDRTVFLVVGAPDRHQRQLVKWARGANPLIQISQLSSINEAQALLQALERPKNTSVVIYFRSFSASSDDQQPYETTEELVAAFKSKLIIWERPFSESASDYFRRPPGTEHTFLLPECRSLSPSWYYRGAITVYPYLLIGVFLADVKKHGSEVLDRLRARPEDWQSWVLQVSPLKPRPKMHTLPDWILGVWRWVLPSRAS